MREAHEPDVVADRRSADASVTDVAITGSPDRTSLSPQRVLALQRRIGNAAVGELLRRTGLRPEPGPRRLARKLNDAQLATTDASAIMADETYIESNLVSFDFFGAELAVLHYKDGGTLRLGLVPEWITTPVEGVDYHSTSHSRMPADPGKLRFVAGGQPTLMAAPDRMPFAEVVNRLSDTVTFKLDPPSGRIVPTQVNSITAPRLCAALRDAEADYVKNFDAFAAGGTKIARRGRGHGRDRGRRRGRAPLGPLQLDHQHGAHRRLWAHGAIRARARGDRRRQAGRGQDGRGRRDDDRQPGLAGLPRVARLCA
jgi:hypothetical protein